MERFRDELGDWRLVLHCPYGARVHAPWALAIAARLRERYGGDGRAGAAHRRRDRHPRPRRRRPAAGRTRRVRRRTRWSRSSPRELGRSALFAARFRECAARALLLPQAARGRRTPLWQQRQRSAQLLSVASKYGTFPIVLETVRECLQDVFDVPGLVSAHARAVGRGGSGWSTWRPRCRRRSAGRCCSATSGRSCTRATRRWPSAVPRRSRWTPPCWPSCSARPSSRELLDPLDRRGFPADAAAAFAGPGQPRPGECRGPAPRSSGRCPPMRSGPRAALTRPLPRAGSTRAGGPAAGDPRCGSRARPGGRRSRTRAGSGTRSACRCRARRAGRLRRAGRRPAR